MKKCIYLFLATFFLSSCVFFRDEKKEIFKGPWKDHAQNAWNYYARELPKRGIQLKKPSSLNTKFREAEGTLGRGEDRFPYFTMDGGKIGGYLSGYCNGGATTVLAREISGWWNRNVGTHEVGHHANNHSLCSGENKGHPDEFKGVAPHWPYWRGRGDVRAFHYSYEKDGNFVCVLFVEDINSRKFLTKEQLDDIAEKLLE